MHVFKQSNEKYGRLPGPVLTIASVQTKLHSVNETINTHICILVCKQN